MRGDGGEVGRFGILRGKTNCFVFQWSLDEGKFKTAKWFTLGFELGLGRIGLVSGFCGPYLAQFLSHVVFSYLIAHIWANFFTSSFSVYLIRFLVTSMNF